MHKYLLRDKKGLIFVIFINTVNTLLVTGLALVYGGLVDLVANGADINRLLIALAFALAYSLVAAGSGWIKHFARNVYHCRMNFAMRNDFFRKIINQRYEKIASEDSSKYYNQMTDDIGTVSWSIWMFIDMVDRVVAVVSGFVAAVSLNWKVALVMTGMTVFMAIIPLAIKKKLDLAHVENSKARKKFALTAKDNFQGASIVKSFSGEKQAAKELKKTSDICIGTDRKATKVDAAANGLGQIVQNISILVLIGFTCYLIIGAEPGIEVGSVLSIVQIGMGFYGAIIAAAAIVTNFLGTKTIRKTIGALLMSPDNNTEAKERHFKDSIVFNNVSFTYPDKERVVMDKMSLVFEKNKKYLVLGKSGSGKSTMLKLLAKFYESYEGSILFDGEEYRDIDDREITKIVAIAQQNCYLFNRSFRENIDYLGTGDKEKLERIIRFVRLDDFVALLPEGYDTVVDEEVNQVSGGEKLRINLARSLYRDSEILLLDEVTSALDKTTSNQVENNLLGLADRTLINVCHKFNDSTLQKYDKIIIIEDGRVAEEGSYAELFDSEKLAMYRNVAEEEE